MIHRHAVTTGPDGGEDDSGIVAPGQILLLSRLGHELRSPLTGIIGLTRMMLLKVSDRKVDTSVQTRQLELMSTSAEQLLHTVDRVVVAVEAGTDPHTAGGRRLDCRALVTVLVAQAEGAADAHGRHVHVDVPTFPVVVRTDEDALCRILTELLDNAVKYTDHDEIHVCLQPAGPGRVRLSVRDDGPGMTAEEITRVQEPFTRGTAAETRGVAGSGLGLYIAHRLATRCRAHLSMYSPPGGGTTAILELDGGNPTATATAQL